VSADPTAECANPPDGPDVGGHACAPAGNATDVVVVVVVKPSVTSVHGAQPCDRNPASVGAIVTVCGRIPAPLAMMSAVCPPKPRSRSQ